MAERKSQNKYYPPDWDPSKGSVNKYVGQHPLRDRAKKIKQGILVIRFEMPYNIWCGGCNIHIGMGVRYNAEKKKIGNYYTTPIWQFRMKCHLCDNYFEIQTDPKNHDYVITSGARRKEQRWDPKENDQIETEDKATQKKMATDAMYKLEHGSDDQKRGKTTIATLGEMEERKSSYRDDYMLNKLARQKFRDEKKELKVKENEDKALLLRSSLDMPLVEESEEDKHLAGLLKFSSPQSYDEKQKQKRKEIECRPLFASASPKSSLDLLKKQISSSGSSSPFDNVHITSKTLALNHKMLGVRTRQINRKKVQEKKCLPSIPEESLSRQSCANRSNGNTEISESENISDQNHSSIQDFEHSTVEKDRIYLQDHVKQNCETDVIIKRTEDKNVTETDNDDSSSNALNLVSAYSSSDSESSNND